MRKRIIDRSETYELLLAHHGCMIGARMAYDDHDEHDHAVMLARAHEITHEIMNRVPGAMETLSSVLSRRRAENGAGRD
jgi:hypothetical protein